MTTLIHFTKFMLDLGLKIVNYYFFPQLVQGIPNLDFDSHSVHFASLLGADLDWHYLENEV